MLADVKVRMKVVDFDGILKLRNSRLINSRILKKELPVFPWSLNLKQHRILK
jgi:hypothetical protein